MQRREFCKLIGLSAALNAVGVAGAAEKSDPYVPVTDSLVLRKLDQWQDWKFGFMMHWGPYSQWGVVESWSICSEDWIKRPAGISYVDYKKKYQALPKTFNPIGFDPDVWASVAKNAGMKYVVFTTKHHDGFSMFDTRQTDYRITAPDVPFHTNPRANIANEIFAAFRRQSFGIGAYFSKPDWHSPDYWAPEWATPNRNVNYDTRKYTDRWQRFVAFVHSQIGELTSEYGSLDILWLDGGLPDLGCEFGACGAGTNPFQQGGYTYTPGSNARTSPTLWQSLGELFAGINWTDPNGRLFGTHYCGPGGGGTSSGPLDSACQAHDACYTKHGLQWYDNFNPANFLNGKGRAIQACNQQLCDAASRVGGPGASTVKSYFTWTGDYGCHK